MSGSTATTLGVTPTDPGNVAGALGVGTGASAPFSTSNPQPETAVEGGLPLPAGAIQPSQSAMDFQTQLQAGNPNNMGFYVGNAGNPSTSGDPNANPWVPTAGNPNFTVNAQGTADLTPAGQQALEAASVWGAAHPHKEGFFGKLADTLVGSPITGILSAIGFPLAVGGGVAALGGAAAGGGAAAADAASLAAASDPEFLAAVPATSAADLAGASDVASSLGFGGLAGGGGVAAGGGADIGGATADIGAGAADIGGPGATASSLGVTPDATFAVNWTPQEAAAVGADLPVPPMPPGDSAAAVGPMGGGVPVSADATSGAALDQPLFDMQAAIDDAAKGVAPANFWDKGVGWLTSGLKNITPLQALGGLTSGIGLVSNMMRGGQTGNVPASLSALTDQANATAAQGKALSGYLSSGTLPTALQANLDEATRSAIQGIKSKYAANGIPPNSTMEQQDINSLMLQAQGTKAQIENQLLTTGSSLINASAAELNQILNANIGLSNETNRAISNLASALAGGGNKITLNATPA